MSGSSDDYSDEQWRESAEHARLKDLSREQLLLLHRHWMCANLQKRMFEAELKKIDPKKFLDQIRSHTDLSAFMHTWYSFLYSVVEAMLSPKEGRSIDLRGPFRTEIDGLSDTLRRFRNAVFHVSPDSYLDDRIAALFSDPAAGADVIRREHVSFGRLFYDELERRKAGEQG